MAFIAAAASAIASWATASVVGGALVRLGAGLLLSAASRAFMPGPQQQRRNVTPRTFSTRNPVTPRDLVYGNVRKGGAVVWIDTSEDESNFLSMVIVLAGHRVESIGTIYFDGVAAIPAGSDVGTGRWNKNGRVFADVRRFLGDDDQEAAQTLIDRHPSTWSVAHRLRGCAYVAVRIAFDTEDPQGVPSVSADMFGKNDILDPRNGTRSYRDNAALCLADYMTMDRQRGGLGVPLGEDGIDVDDLIEAANICDELVNRPEGGVERRYTCNGVLTLSSDSTPQDRIRALLTGMAGSITDTTPYRIRAGAYRPPEFSFGLDDLRGPLSVQVLESGSEICNGTRGIFVSPDNEWQPDDFPPVQSAVYLEQDEGVERWHDINLPFTISASAAQRIAKIDLERTRRQVSVSTVGSARWLVAMPGDVVNLTVERYGWSSKPFEVQSMRPRFEGSAILVDVTLRETSPLVFSFDATEAQIYEAAPTTTLPEPWNVPAPGFITVQDSLYVTRDGSGVKALAALSWIASPSSFVLEYRVRARPPGGQYRSVGTTRETSFEVLDTEPGIWEFEVRAVSSTGAFSPPTTRSIELTGLSSPPAALQSVALQQAGGLAVLRWDQAPELDVRQGGRIAIRHSHRQTGAEWASSRSLASEPGGSTISVLPLIPGTYLIRAEDSTGNLGPITARPADGAQIVDFTAAGSLQEDTTFLGTGTDVYLTTISSVPGLILGASTASFDDVTDVDALVSWDFIDGTISLSGSYDFASGISLAVATRLRLRSEIAVEAYNPFNDFDSRLGSVDSWLDWDGTDGAEVDCYVEVRTTKDDPAGTPSWSEWGRLDAGEVFARGVQARAQLSTADTGHTPFVTQLRLYADEVAA